jgi:THO complex subunit 2
MLRFLQSCIFPRVICSEVDAVYCAEFVRAMHITKTNDFQTIVFFDKVFNF